MCLDEDMQNIFKMSPLFISKRHVEKNLNKIPICSTCIWLNIYEKNAKFIPYFSV